MEEVQSFEELTYDLLLSWDFYSEQENYLEFFRNFYKILNEIKMETFRERLPIDQLMLDLYSVIKIFKQNEIKLNSIFQTLDKEPENSISLQETFASHIENFKIIKSQKKDVNKAFTTIIDILNLLEVHFEGKYLILS